MVNICPLKANIVKDRREPWIGGSVYHFISNLGSIDKLVAKAQSIVFKSGSRYHVETADEIYFILK